MSEFKYVGSELELFAGVHNWKSYWSSRIRPFVSGDVLEVGAGIGANTPYLHQSTRGGRWVCLEPDPVLADQLRSNLRQQTAQENCEVFCGTVQSLDQSNFDTVVYIDVLEHIEDDRQELQTAAKLLRIGGRLIVLAPAHQRLFTPFDAAIGHFRRYNRPMFRGLTPPSLVLERVWYLDSVGLLLSAANRCFLRQAMPTREQLQFWDRCVIPLSRICDRCSFGLIGKSIAGVWQKSYRPA